MEQTNNKNSGQTEGQAQGQQATHSGWSYYLSAYAKYRDECMRLSRLVNSGSISQATEALNGYHGTLYTMAQQIFQFYDDGTETKLTNDWLELGEEVNDYLSTYRDPQMRAQMSWEMKLEIPREVKLKLLKYFNKVDRLAAEAGLHVNKEDKSKKEPKKGLLGLGHK